MIKTLLTWSIAVVVGCTTNCYAQALPETDLWLLKVENGVPVNPVRISDADGYNNQPHFSDDGTVVFYTREMPGGENGQTDIAVFDTRTLKTRMLNNTAESEYSPTPMPGRNAVSVIGQDLDGVQLLWAIDVGSGEMEVLFPDIQPVGYHAWINDQDVAMFILGDSFTLQTASLGTAGTKVVADNIGRSIRRHPDSGFIVYVDGNDEPWSIATLNPQTGAKKLVLPLFPASEDFTIDSHGNFWTGNDSKLYKRAPVDNRWQLVTDLSGHGIHNITRLAIHLESGQMALVSDNTSTD